MPDNISVSLGEVKTKPRILLLTLPSLFGAMIINRLADEPDLDLIGVGFSDRLDPKKGRWTGVRDFHRRTGWRYLYYSALVADVAWDWLRLTRRPAGLKKSGLSVQYLKNVNSPSALDWLEKLKPDYIVSFYFNQWIGRKVRAQATHDTLNVHPSPLPALRGPDPVFRALQRGLNSTAVTIHKIADEIDAGPMLAQQALDIPSGCSAFALYHFLIQQGTELLVRYLQAERQPPISPATPSTGNDYSTYPTPTETAEFLKSGRRLISLREWRDAVSAIA